MAKDIKAKRTGEMSTNAAELYAFINRVRHAALRCRLHVVQLQHVSAAML
jgi:hypothetical protein